MESKKERRQFFPYKTDIMEGGKVTLDRLLNNNYYYFPTFFCPLRKFSENKSLSMQLK